jgi:dTDP-4-dehydrorhamnose reductase
MSRELAVVVIGAGGRLGQALVRGYTGRYAVTGFNHSQLDLGRLGDLEVTLRAQRCDVLINAAALTNVDYCEDHRAEAMRLNAEAPALMARICDERGARFIHVSTDYVFDGEKRTPYTEEDLAHPISVYGESKREGEIQALQANPAALVLRVSWVFGPDRPSFVDAILERARKEKRVSAVADKFSTPTYTEEIAALLKPFLEGEIPGGILHLANRGSCSWQEYAQWALDCCHRFGVMMKATKVEPAALKDMRNFVARRPVYTVLGTEKYQRLTGKSPRDWHDVVEEYVRLHFAQRPVPQSAG